MQAMNNMIVMYVILKTTGLVLYNGCKIWFERINKYNSNMQIINPIDNSDTVAMSSPSIKAKVGRWVFFGDCYYEFIMDSCR